MLYLNKLTRDIKKNINTEMKRKMILDNHQIDDWKHEKMSV